jgi:hypothetical protein
VHAKSAIEWLEWLLRNLANFDESPLTDVFSGIIGGTDTGSC